MTPHWMMVRPTCFPSLACLSQLWVPVFFYVPFVSVFLFTNSNLYLLLLTYCYESYVNECSYTAPNLNRSASSFYEPYYYFSVVAVHSGTVGEQPCPFSRFRVACGRDQCLGGSQLVPGQCHLHGDVAHMQRLKQASHRTGVRQQSYNDPHFHLIAGVKSVCIPARSRWPLSLSHAYS